MPNQEPGGTWFPLHSEVVMENGQILCTRNPTGHRVLIDYRFELPCGKLKKISVVSSQCAAVVSLNLMFSSHTESR